MRSVDVAHFLTSSFSTKKEKGKKMKNKIKTREEDVQMKEREREKENRRTHWQNGNKIENTRRAISYGIVARWESRQPNTAGNSRDPRRKWQAP